MGKAKELSGYAGWWLRSRADRGRPLVTTVITHLGCNLACRHCNLRKEAASGALPEASLGYDAVCRDLEERYARGARIAYFEGGEPTAWRDGGRDLGDLIRKAQDVGYLSTGYTTNGTGRMFTESSVISVSLDGPREVHDRIRAPGVYDRLMANLGRLEGYGGSVFANMVVQRANVDSVRDVAEIAEKNPAIDGAVFNFLTPPPEEENLTHEEKVRAVEELLSLKREGLPVLNSEKGLRLLLEEDWESRCPTGMSSFTLPDGRHVDGCPMRANGASCRRCGFAAVREYYLIDRASLSTVAQLAPTFALSGRRRRDGRGAAEPPPGRLRGR